MSNKSIKCCGNTLNNGQKTIQNDECKCYESNSPCIIVHGGAGNFSEAVVIEKMTGCKKAAINGYKKLIDGESSVDAVESALWWLECDEFYNSGYGSVLNELGKVQMDASMMDGLSFKCGSVAAVSDIEHPITLAKYVMNNFPNSIFVGEGAKNLAKYANINWLSDGNMVAPAARIAYLVDQTGALEPDMDIDNIAQLDMTQDSLDTVGCVAYDGYSIAAGTTTGGLNRKLVGRVGDSPLLGCGTYATKYTGCSLTGHGESIAKLGLAREIVEDIERGYRSEEALHKHLNNMLKSHEQVGGGIILQCDGRWATYFTSSKMPYAVIENDLITYGARLYEERREMYNSDGNSCDCEYPNIIAIDRGLLSEKLFSFQEWQRYIECRKIILVHAHYPTKMKYSPESVEVDDLYLKFIKFLNSKSNREEPEVKNTKGYLPEELAHALAKYVSSLNVQNVSPEAIDIFPPSLTPLHSYLQQLLDHPLYDIPMIVHKDFFLTKVGYMTKPNVLMELAKQCDIQLKIMDANLHFLEKHVPPFEQPRMPSVEKLNQKIEVQDDTSEILKDESGILNNYIDEKTPCTVKVDVTKKQWFEEVQSDVDNSKRENYAGEDFLFTETLPNGRLAIRTDIGVVEKEENSVPSDNGGMFSAILDRKFCDKYGIELSSKEKESISKLDKRKPNSLRKLARNSKGHFVKPNIAREKTNQDKSESTPENVNFVTNSQTSAASETCTRRESAMESDAFDLGSLDLNEADIKNGFCDLDNYFNLSDISFFAELDDAVPQTDCKKDLLYFFQPFKDYWIYDCIFSRVKSKNFAIFEKSLPRTFRWLLNECALTVEMTTMDLYQELCLIEAYYSQILIPGLSGDNKSKQVNEILKNKLNIILSKW